MTAALVTDDIDRPELDPRTYRIIRLENDLEALLVHDAETDKASAALDVHVGHLSDPWNAAGLAHFCEHLLFMGTEKYPRENAYSEYLSAHNGSSNAYTATVDTNYFFDVGHEFLEPALDRFSQFFISPLFLESCKDREILAVDSENKKNLQNDMWRAYQLEKSLSNPNHVYSKFGTGNLETLKEIPEQLGHDVRDELIKFHSECYSANQMKLVILGRQSLDALQELAVTKFSAIANKCKNAPYFGQDILRPGKELGMVYTFKPVKEVRNLEICFPIPECDYLWRSQPAHYIAHLIGHEGEGSILSCLKARGWCLVLGAGGSSASPGVDFFKISMELTQEGCRNWQKIVEIIFAYIGILRREGPQEWIFDELKLISEAQFRFQEKQPASRFAANMSSKLQGPIDRQFILGTSVPREYRPAEIQQVMDALNHTNFRVALADPAVEGADQVEKYYGTKYRLDNLPTDLLQSCSLGSTSAFPDLHLPIKNDFIPEEFDTHKKELDKKSKRPSLIKNSKFVRLWHKKDDTFWVPKANYLFLFRNPIMMESVRSAVLVKLFIELLKDSMNEYAYNADIAGLQYAMDPTVGAFTLTFSGYNHKMGVLVEKVMQKLRFLPVDPSRFEIEKDRLVRDLGNFDFEAPYAQVSYHASLILAQTAWSKDEQAVAAAQVTHADLQAFSNQLFQQYHLEILAHGNVNKNDALTTCQIVEDILSAKNDTFSARRSVILLKTKSVPHDPYESAFETAGYSTYFVPVLDHEMINLDGLRDRCLVATEQYSGFIVTSQRSVEALGKVLPELSADQRTKVLSISVYTVGPATRKAIENLGFDQVLGSESGNGDALSDYIISRRDPAETKPLFFAVGDKRRDIINKRMANANVPLEELVVYKTITASTFAEDFTKAIQELGQPPGWLIFFSPAGADIALDYLRANQHVSRIATIGPTTEAYLTNQWHMTPDVVSPVPEPSALVRSLCSEEIPRALPSSEVRSLTALWLPQRSHYISRELVDVSNTNSCIEYYVQFGSTSDVELSAMGRLFAQICSEPVFNHLRTQEQLGYIVASGSKVTLTSSGFRILVQSERDTTFLASRIEAFLDHFRDFLMNISTEEFEKQRTSLLDKLNERLKNLGQETKRYWAQITSSNYNFNEVEEQSVLIRAITPAQLLAFFNEYVHYESGKRRHLSMCMVAHKAVPVAPTSLKTEPVQISDIASFKSTCDVMARPSGDLDAFVVDLTTDSKL